MAVMRMPPLGIAAKRALFNLLVWAVVLAIVFPLIWMVSTALRPETEAFTRPPMLIPHSWTLENFKELLYETPFLVYFRNSLIVATASTLFVITVATLGAYSLVRFRYRGRQVMAQVILFTYLLPSVVLLLPLYMLMAWLGLVNTLFSLVILYTTFGVPFALWLLRSFISAIPMDLEDAARIDGASRMRAFFDIILPQAVPGIISAALFKFIVSWNEYLYALVLINNDANKTLPPGVIAMLVGMTEIDWPLLMAASVLMSMPLIVAFTFLQRQLVTGFSAGAVKG